MKRTKGLDHCTIGLEGHWIKKVQKIGKSRPLFLIQ